MTDRLKGMLIGAAAAYAGATVGAYLLTHRDPPAPTPCYCDFTVREGGRLNVGPGGAELCSPVDLDSFGTEPKVRRVRR